MSKHLDKAYIITGNPQREERWEYPLEAVREIVLNMIVHRDYTRSTDSSIKMFHDHIEFYNPGSLLPPLDVEHLLDEKYTSVVRNKQIAQMFKEAGKIEKYGSGIKRIIDAFNRYNLPAPVFENFLDGFKVTVFNGKTVPEKVPENQQKIIDFMAGDSFITIPELSRKIGISERKIRENISKLKIKELVRRIGPDRGGHWEVL